MAIRGTKKTIEALELLFETGKKPTQQDFFDFLSSFLHRDEDISFLVSLAKATLTDVQVGVENSRFMTSLRTYQSILWWVRLGKLPLLNTDIVELVDGRINALFATDDADSIIDTLGEVIQAFQGFNEEVGALNTLRSRILSLESILYQIPQNLRQVQNTFDSLQSQVTTAKNTADSAVSLANNAQSAANGAQGTANSAQSSANNAQTSANNAQYKADDAWDRANGAQGTANGAQGSANNAQNTANSATTLANNAQSKANDAYGYAIDALVKNNIQDISLANHGGWIADIYNRINAAGIP